MGLWVIYVALPAAALQSVHGISIAPRPDWWLAVATPWIGALLAIVLICPLSFALGWSRQRCGALLLAGGWGNTSFVGLPMLAALAGSEWIGLGVGIDLFGSYLALSTLGIAIATISSSRTFNGRIILKRIFTFPPFIAILVALATNHLPQPQWLSQSLDALSNTLAPIALASVGFSLRFNRPSEWLVPLGVGMTYRLFVAPLMILVLYVVLREGADPAACRNSRYGNAADARREHRRHGPRSRARPCCPAQCSRPACVLADRWGMVVGGRCVVIIPPERFLLMLRPHCCAPGPA